MINPGAGWQVPDWTSNITFQMSSPFTAGGAAGGSYLTVPQTPFHARDFHWENGWELLWLGTGYYPNGEPIDVANQNRIISQASSVLNPRIPYMIYYNRYTGKIRLFAGLYTDFGAVHSVSVDLKFNEIQVDQGRINGIMRHLGNYDTPLDQPSEYTLQQGVNSMKPVSGSNNIKTWYTFDFQTAYDPCVCQNLTTLNFDFRAVQSSDISLYGRMITLEEDLVDAEGNPIWDDGFLSVQDVNNNVENGYIMRDKLTGLVDDYNESLETYKQQMEDREFGKLGWFQEVLGDMKSQIIDGAAGFIPGGEIAANLIKRNLTLGADSADVHDMVDKGGKAILGQGYDFLSTQIFGKNVKPVRPTIPTASFSEMRFSGNVTTTNLISLSGFYTPGGDVSLGDLTPFNYPAYNRPLGLYATLKTPEVEFLSAATEITETVINTVVEVDSSDLEKFYPIYVYIRTDSTVWKSRTVHQRVHIKLKEALFYALNRALDFNMEKTKVYVSFNVEMENAKNLDFTFPGSLITHSDRIDSVRNTFVDETNLWVLHDAKNIDKPGMQNLARKVELTSGWYDVENVTNLLFGEKFSTTMYYSELHEKDICVAGCPPTNPDNYDEEIPVITEWDLKYRPTKITMKVMADMYFDQESYLDEGINTNQVFTYLLLDESRGINLIEDQGNIHSPEDFNEFVKMNPGELHVLHPTLLYPNCPMVVVSNSGIPNTVRTERISVENLVLGVYSAGPYKIEAYDYIHLKPGTIVAAGNINLRINKEIYEGDVSEPANSSELESFCSSQGQYNAGSASVSALERSRLRVDEIKSRKFEYINEITANIISIHPNPATDFIHITSTVKPIAGTEIFDISGRTLIRQVPQEENASTSILDIRALPTGMYLLKVQCGDEFHTEKLMIAR